MDGWERPVNVVVSVDDDHLDALDKVVTELRHAGLRVDSVLDAVGVVTGTVAGVSVRALESVPGVAEVELQRVNRVAPPDAEVQ
jgi:ribosome-interacting GTPase 1